MYTVRHHEKITEFRTAQLQTVKHERRTAINLLHGKSPEEKKRNILYVHKDISQTAGVRHQSSYPNECCNMWRILSRNCAGHCGLTTDISVTFKLSTLIKQLMLV